MKTPWRWWRERQATDKTCKHLALMTEDITNITDRLVAFVWEDIEKIIDQCDELYEDGFRLIVDPAPEEEIVEVTMDEIAKLKGVPVERLRVKKEDK